MGAFLPFCKVVREDWGMKGQSLKERGNTLGKGIPLNKPKHYTTHLNATETICRSLPNLCLHSRESEGKHTL